MDNEDKERHRHSSLSHTSIQPTKADMQAEMSPPCAEKDAVVDDVAQRRQDKMKKRRKVVFDKRCRASDPRNAPHHGVVPRLLPTNDQETQFAKKRLFQLDAESVAERALYGDDEIIDEYDAMCAGGSAIGDDPEWESVENANQKDGIIMEADKTMASGMSESNPLAAADDSESVAATAILEAKPAPKERTPKTFGGDPQQSSHDVVEGAARNDGKYVVAPESEEKISHDDHNAEVKSNSIGQGQKEDSSDILLTNDGGTASEDHNQDQRPEAGKHAASGVSPSPVSLPVEEDLLVDTNGELRGAYITLKEDELEVMELLLDVYGKAEKELRNVQNYTEHLKHYNFPTAGFPVAPGLDGSKWFSSCASKQRISEMQSFVENKIRNKLKEIDYCTKDQKLELHLSFLKTAEETDVQPPHIDHKWENVVPPTKKPRTPRCCYKGNYKEWVPFIALFPLTKDGMRVEVWHARSQHNQPEHPEHTVGRLVDIPYGQILLLRADVIHAGGFRTADSGNPRGHFYIYKTPGGVVHPIHLSNCYDVEIDGKKFPLIHLYKHHPDCADTNRVEFTWLYGKARSEK